jgi:hypothetical protein
VIPLENYILQIKFDNGEEKVFDVKPYIRGSWYDRLGDAGYFKTAMVDGFTVVWPEGQDLCPDELYEMSRPRDDFHE